MRYVGLFVLVGMTSVASVARAQTPAAANPCLRADSLAESSEVRRLWEYAVVTFAEREAFLDKYHYTVDLWQHDSSEEGLKVDDTTFVPKGSSVWTDYVNEPLMFREGRSLFHWAGYWNFNLPYDQLFSRREFFRRFCFDDRVIDAGNGVAQIRFSQRVHKKDEVDVVGTMTFTKDVPGASRVDWEYLVHGKTIGRSQNTFAGVEIDGTTLFLALRNSYQAIDPQTHAVFYSGYLEPKRSGFTRIHR